MPNRTTAALLVLFFGGLLALWWADYAGIATERKDKVTEGLVLPQLYDVKAEDVRRVEIAGGPRKDAITFERGAGGRWRMTEPVDTLADGARVEALIAGLKALRRSTDAGTIAGPAADYGLEGARTVRLFKDLGTAPPLATLEVGDVLGKEDLRYARAPGAKGAELTDARRLAAVDLAAADWRERMLFTVSPYESSRLDVRGPGGPLELARVGPGRWRIRRPIDVPADFAKVQGVLADLGALHVEDKAAGFVADNVKDADLKTYGLDVPRWTITLGEKSTSQTVEIGKDAPGKPGRAYARRADQDDIVLVNAGPLEALGKGPDALRGQKLADLDPARVEAVSVRVEGIDHDLARTAGGWVEVGREAGRLKVVGKADPQVVQTLLLKLEALETSQFLDPNKVPDAESGLKAPRFVIKAWQSPSDAPESRTDPWWPAGEPAAEITLGRQDAFKKAIYARAAGDPSVLTVPDNVLEALPTGPLAFRDRSLLAQDRSGFERFTVRDGRREAVVEGPAHPVGANPFLDWRMTEPSPAPADPQAIARLAVLLSGLRAESLVAESAPDPKAYGLDDPTLAIAWTLRPAAIRKGTPATRVLAVGGEVPGRKGVRYARISGDPLIFTLAPQAVDILRAELRDRRVLEFPAEKASRIVLRWPGRSITLDRDPSSTSWEPGPGADLSGFDLARVTPLIQALSRLNALRFAQYEGPFPADSGLSPPAFTAQITLEGDPTPRVLHLGAGTPGLVAGRFATTSTSTSAGGSGLIAVLPDVGWSTWITPPGRADELPEDVFQAPKD